MSTGDGVDTFPSAGSRKEWVPRGPILVCAPYHGRDELYEYMICRGAKMAEL